MADETRVTGWIEFGHHGVSHYRIWQRHTHHGMYQRHEWRRVGDLFTRMDDWIAVPSTSWCVDAKPVEDDGRTVLTRCDSPAFAA
jgi:hypothetical protein